MCYFILWSLFIPSRNSDEVFTIITIWHHIEHYMSLRSRYHSSSVVLTKADHLFIHNYIRSLLNIIFNHILRCGRRLSVIIKLNMGQYGPILVNSEPLK